MHVYSNPYMIAVFVVMLGLLAFDVVHKRRSRKAKQAKDSKAQ